MTDQKDQDDKYDKNNNDKTVEAAKDIINQYRDAYKSINPTVLFNLSQLKEISKQPKQEKPEAAFAQIQTHLGPAETGETLRQERWHGNKVVCPYCNSKHVKRLSVAEQKTQHNYKYLCVDCKATFNDDSETKMEGTIPPIHTWMMCWYLLGTTTSLQFIATKLGLSLATVEMMVQHMQKLFKAQQPLKNFMSFEEWSLKHGASYKNALQKAQAKITERFRGYNVGQEEDTAEVRRQRSRVEQDMDPDKPNSPRPRYRGG